MTEMAHPEQSPLLEITDLSIRIGRTEIVSIDHCVLGTGQRLGLVGESGSGKTMTAMSLAGLQPAEAVLSGSIRFDGQEIVGRTDRQLAQVRGSRIGVIFQDPLRALNPVIRVGRQVAEAIRLHHRMPSPAVRARVLELFEQVQLADPAAIARRYPHQLSGGQRQRVLIAMAIAARPRLLIADEPTTALDVTVQKAILDLLLSLSAEHEMALLFVSHDLGVVRAVSDRVAVLYGGQLVETGPADEVIGEPRHRYTEALIATNPGHSLTTGLETTMGQPLTVIPGSVPAAGRFPSGCHFRGRCGHADETCAETPPVVNITPEHEHKCWHPAAPTSSGHESAGDLR